MKRLFLLVSIVALLLGAASVATAQTGVTWTMQVYDNPYLIDPVEVATTSDRIFYEWGFGGPASGIVDNFSIRFGTETFFPAGTYRFYVDADDQVRLSIDERSIIDTLNGGQTEQTLIADVQLAGMHRLQIDYREFTGVAYLKVSWQNVLDIGKPTPGAPAATVQATTLNVRNFPSTVGTDVITKVSAGAVYPVVGRLADNSWWQIQANGVTGWVFGALVRVENGGAVPVISPQVSGSTPGTGSTAAPSPTGFNATTLANLRLRSTPQITNNTLTTIPRGAVVPVLGRNSNTSWLQVNYNGQVGWVSIAFLSIEPPLIVDNVPVNG